MSTDMQRYSIENQAAVIAAFANARNLKIVRTYEDRGESGLRIKNRGGLKQLLELVSSGAADFSHLLVYDVSRWGRFQDTDESAHHEFTCKKAGVKVEYCAEQFDNDGSMLSSIVKNIKRVMAAEYSRELSSKVHAGQLRLAALGFHVGGFVKYGLRRELVDEDRVSKGYLERGQQKNLKTDRVIVRCGSPNEIETLQRIFCEFVEQRKSSSEIARQLNRDMIPNQYGRPWTSWVIRGILRNENYIGNTVYNRESNTLRECKVKNPPSQWIRNECSIAPAIDKATFLRAQARMKLRWEDLTDDEMLDRLRRLLKKAGGLNQRLIESTLGVPSRSTYARRFGSLIEAYRCIGYQVKHDLDWIARKHECRKLLMGVADNLSGRLQKAGVAASYDSVTKLLTTNDQLAISLRLARCWLYRNQGPIWTINRRAPFPDGYLVVIRLDEQNTNALDYILLPTGWVVGRKLRLADCGWRRFRGCCFQTIDELSKAILRSHRRASTDRRPKRRGGRCSKT